MTYWWLRIQLWFSSIHVHKYHWTPWFRSGGDFLGTHTVIITDKGSCAKCDKVKWHRRVR